MIRRIEGNGYVWERLGGIGVVLVVLGGMFRRVRNWERCFGSWGGWCVGYGAAPFSAERWWFVCICWEI